MGLGDFKKKESSSKKSKKNTSEPEQPGNTLEHMDRLEHGGPKSKHYVDSYTEEHAEYFVNGKMLLWERTMRRWGNWFLRQYSDDGTYRGPDPDFMWVSEVTPEDEWHETWEDVTGEWKEASALIHYHSCGEKCIMEYEDQAWARCPGCNTVLIDADRHNRRWLKREKDGGDESFDGPQSGLMSFMGGSE